MTENLWPKRLIVLGSTGSIGLNTLKVIEHLNRSRPGCIEVVGLAAGRSVRALAQQAERFNVPTVAVAQPHLARELGAALPRTTKVLAGPDAAEQLVRDTEATDVAGAIVGAAGLPAMVAAAELGRRIHLANKETLVAAGDLVTRLADRSGAVILPVDSEHAAIAQCLEGAQHKDVMRLVLTASGGPFREASAETIRNATVDQALKHPTWKMGPKITIDSATMMNKALEIIEAHWLFKQPGERIDVVIHPQSIIHSFVEFKDHSILAQLGPPDMCGPIQHAMTYPDKWGGCAQQLDWTRLGTLDFQPPDGDRFPALRLAYRVIDLGGTAGAIVNAANEVAVHAFIDQRIRFGQIPELAQQALETLPVEPVKTLAGVLDADAAARDFVREELNRLEPAAVTPQAASPRSARKD
ncbi:1-deoxy-D-xylulose-5-phosphate reductoisomerase [Mucisphaera calidilacus]|uniref:1-deoxy-D-xylulose 5-phosphate reductoisomerase n=1 Tax=Mucisphaera calidilacus TaxID=2527982 RepID=A0A518BVH4_9BACT|nr:1-deoxy-D-xylulose-5-phosphate reductoisomerase [Mucisphaera calidilacus]QDU70985.1 1-deoxy-D-xylulose 5-phosphate reductoisomerase [Mucisphaera calidilacus]